MLNANELKPQEQLVLQVLNIEPYAVSRCSPAMFDFTMAMSNDDAVPFWFPIWLCLRGYNKGHLRLPKDSPAVFTTSSESNIWAAFKWFTDTHCNTPERCARFAVK